MAVLVKGNSVKLDALSFSLWSGYVLPIFVERYFSSIATNNDAERTTFYIDLVFCKEISSIVKMGYWCLSRHL